MDENNNVVEQNKNNQKIIKYIIVIVLLIVVGVTCFIIGSMSNKQNKNNNIEEQEENNTEKDNSKNNENVQSLTDEEKIMKFVIVGLETRNIGESNESFIKGYSKPLTIYDKIKITLTQLIIIEEKFQALDTVPSNYIAKYDKKYDINEYDFYELKVKDFKKVYKDLFNEDVNFDLKEINSDKIGSQTCPYILGLSNDESIIYLHGLKGQCQKLKNHPDREVLYKNIKIDKDENYYYVYQYVGIHNLGSQYEAEYYMDLKGNIIKKQEDFNKKIEDFSFNENEDKFSVLVWKFDMNTNFVSTSIE